MADNVAITAGAGTTVATDDVGGVHYQRIKLALGADGAAADVSTTNPVPVGQPSDVVTVTPTLDTSAYAAGDVLFATTAFAGAVAVNDGRSLLQSLSVIDKDDQKTAFKLHFFNVNVTSGAFNGVPSISDADAASYLGSVTVNTGDYDDLGGVSVASIKNIGMLLEGVSGGTSVYIFAVTSSTPTHTASGLVLRLGVLYA